MKHKKEANSLSREHRLQQFTPEEKKHKLKRTQRQKRKRTKERGEKTKGCTPAQQSGRVLHMLLSKHSPCLPS
jgi:hypothetical protein